MYFLRAGSWEASTSPSLTAAELRCRRRHHPQPPADDTSGCARIVDLRWRTPPKHPPITPFGCENRLRRPSEQAPARLRFFASCSRSSARKASRFRQHTHLRHTHTCELPMAYSSTHLAMSRRGLAGGCLLLLRPSGSPPRGLAGASRRSKQRSPTPPQGAPGTYWWLATGARGAESVCALPAWGCRHCGAAAPCH